MCLPVPRDGILLTHVPWCIHLASHSVPGGEGKYQDVTVDIGSKYVTVFDPLDGSSNVSSNILLCT
jgi:fructose-1,6-bisphosphatase